MSEGKYQNKTAEKYDNATRRESKDTSERRGKIKDIETESSNAIKTGIFKR